MRFIARQIRHLDFDIFDLTDDGRLKARRTDPAMTSDRISALRTEWEAATDAEACYAFRAEAHAAIRQVVSLITFDSGRNTATLIVGNGLSTYQLRDGRIEDRCQVFRCFKLNGRQAGKDFLSGVL